jgi:hypothetical protein
VCPMPRPDQASCSAQLFPVSGRVQNCVADGTHRGPSLTLRVTMGVCMEADWIRVHTHASGV